MLDALGPAIDALRSGSGTTAASQAATHGAARTADMTAAGAGRSAHVTAGHLHQVQDPGAAAIASQLVQPRPGRTWPLRCPRSACVLLLHDQPTQPLNCLPTPGTHRSGKAVSDEVDPRGLLQAQGNNEVAVLVAAHCSAKSAFTRSRTGASGSICRVTSALSSVAATGCQ